MPMASAMNNRSKVKCRGARLRLGLSLCLVFLASGCATLQPLIHDFNIVPLDQEKQLGQTMVKQIGAAKQLVSDPAPNQTVNRIGQKLVSALPSKEFDYKFYVVQDASPNAFTIPGGTIYVHTGLLNFVDSEDELAGVLAHELGHAYERHPAKGLSRSYGLDYLSSLVLKENKSKLKNMALQIAGGGILNKYGRDDENEADEIGYRLMSRAGYSPDGMILFFKKLERLSGSNGLPAFLSTHPATPERIRRLEALKTLPQSAQSPR